MAKERAGIDTKAIKFKEPPPVIKKRSASLTIPTIKSPLPELLPSKMTVNTEEFVRTSTPIVEMNDDHIIIAQPIEPIHEIHPKRHSLTKITEIEPKPLTKVNEIESKLERLLETPVKTIDSNTSLAASSLDLRKYANSDDISDISEILDFVPIQPKPVPKKRVLFNLDEIKNDNIVNVSSHAHHKEKSHNDDSDLDISSFDDEK